MARLQLVGMLALVAGLTVIPTGSATGSCAAPSVTPPAESASPGRALHVSGRGFVDGCDDVGGSNSFGCEAERETVTPIESVQLRLRQGSRNWSLGKVDAGLASNGRLGHAEWDVAIPIAAKLGKAFLETDYSSAVQIVIGH
jgi:hypothetical protein